MERELTLRHSCDKGTAVESELCGMEKYRRNRERPCTSHRHLSRMDRISGLSIKLGKPEIRLPGGYIYNTLKEVVWQAVEQGRVTCGVQNCAIQLETEPCVLPLCVLLAATPGHSDISTSIHHMLIEAFCLEHSVQLIKVDSVCKLGQLLQGRACPHFDQEFQFLEKSSDLGCVILQHSIGNGSEEDRALTEFCLSDTSQPHRIALQD
ncbi:hypothetical protein EGW08_002797 [Elysia chlorotica]|uniref:Ribosomal protein eL8/eL30/eS12/Gadd45 domain-containing protein n=1 Tax=Elysia chlorotica TaxID=188477 RepID=A0A433U6L3_ELYCH|nr:hypothetical protein EGW08_002797 [Elysia chlorotica]